MAENLDISHLDDSSNSSEESSPPSDSKPPGSGLLSYIPSYSLFYSASSVRNKDRGSIDKSQKQECSTKKDVSRMTPLSAPVNCQIAPFLPTFNNEHRKNRVIGSLKSVLFYPFSSNDASCDKCAGILPPSQRECSCVDTLEIKPPLAPCPQSCDSCCKPQPVPPVYPINKCSIHGSKNSSPPPPTTRSVEEETQQINKKEKKRLSPWSVLVDQSDYGCGCDSDCDTTPTSKTLSFQKFDDCPSSPQQPEVVENRPQNKQPSNLPLTECTEVQGSSTNKQLNSCKLKRPNDLSGSQPNKCQKCKDCGQSNLSSCICQPTQQLCTDNSENKKKEGVNSKYKSVVSALYNTKKTPNDCNIQKEPCECVLLPPKMNSLSPRGEKEPNCQPSGETVECQQSTECTMLPPKLTALMSPTSQETNSPTKLPKSSLHTNKEKKCKHSSCECTLLPPKLTALYPQTAEHNDGDLKSGKGQCQSSNVSCEPKGSSVKTTEDNEKPSSPLRSLFSSSTRKQKQDETLAALDDCQKGTLSEYDVTFSCGCQKKECEEKSSNKRQTFCQMEKSLYEREKKIFSCGCETRKNSNNKEENKSPWKCYKKPSYNQQEHESSSNLCEAKACVQETKKLENYETKTTSELEERKSDCGCQQACGCRKHSDAVKLSCECVGKKSADPFQNISSDEKRRPESHSLPIPSLQSKGGPSSDPVTETSKFSFWCPKKSGKPSPEDPCPPSEEKKVPPSQMKHPATESSKKCECPQCNIVCSCPPYCCCVTQPKCCNINCCCCCSMKKLKKKQILENEAFLLTAAGDSHQKASMCEDKKHDKKEVVEICCPIEIIVKGCEREEKGNESPKDKKNKK